VAFWHDAIREFTARASERLLLMGDVVVAVCGLQWMEPNVISVNTSTSPLIKLGCIPDMYNFVT
jgi:hypothetical protein